MSGMSVFETFGVGKMRVPGGEREFDSLEWKKHPAFNGVELKHLLTGEQTGGVFSFHLVRVAPGSAIGLHVHETQLETHEVIALIDFAELFLRILHPEPYLRSPQGSFPFVTPPCP